MLVHLIPFKPGPIVFLIPDILFIHAQTLQKLIPLLISIPVDTPLHKLIPLLIPAASLKQNGYDLSHNKKSYTGILLWEKVLYNDFVWGKIVYKDFVMGRSHIQECLRVES